jgi:hypothetical protein
VPKPPARATFGGSGGMGSTTRERQGGPAAGPVQLIWVPTFPVLAPLLTRAGGFEGNSQLCRCDTGVD